jgi:pimeloyl-ACP methyl ester carboxylesterase
MDYQIIEESGFKFIETGKGKEPLLLLHGLFGALSNFQGILDAFGNRLNVVVPMLPIYELPLRKATIKSHVDHVEKFVDFKGYDKAHVLGNSLGGHIGLLYALRRPEKIASMILTGSSGLFESAFGTGFPKRGNYDFIKKRTQDTFYDPHVATDELVDEVFEIVNNRNKAMKVLVTAKSAIRHNLEDKLEDIVAPTLLIWGQQDTITPHYVGEKFNELIPNSELVFIDECGHAPMMEHPEQFNNILESFLIKQGVLKTDV